MSPHAIANRPDSSTSTLSPRDKVFEMAASHAPWPFETVTNTRPVVATMRGSASKMASDTSSSSPS